MNGLRTKVVSFRDLLATAWPIILISALGFAVAYEPVWVFYRSARGSPHSLDKLHQLDGQRIAVGAEGSGIRGLAVKLLEANEIPAGSESLLPADGLNAAEALQPGQIAAAFVVAAPEAAVVQVLPRSPGVRAMSFSQAEAYTRRFPSLSKIVLPRGVVDLVRNQLRQLASSSSARSVGPSAELPT